MFFYLKYVTSDAMQNFISETAVFILAMILAQPSGEVQLKAVQGAIKVVRDPEETPNGGFAFVNTTHSATEELE